MRKYDLLSLELFVLVCDLRNIARAAEHAHIVSSAISKRLAQLESALGTPLLERKRYGVSPTPAGETLLQHAREVLDRVNRIDRDMAAYAAGVRGQVRVLASASVIAQWLSGDVSGFLQAPAHQGIQLNVEERTSPAVVRGVRDGNAALGICWDGTDLQGLQSTAYRRDRLAVVVPKAHPLAKNTQLLFEDALDYEHVGMPPNSAVKVLLQRTAVLAGKPLIYSFVVSSFEACIKVVQAGLAISVMPFEVASAANKDKRMRVLPLSDEWAVRQFVVCYRDRAALPQAAALLLEHLTSATRRTR